MKCKRCDIPLTPQEADKAKKRNGYPAGFCLSCQSEWKREANFRARYNISIEEYEEMLLLQDRKCAICYSKLEAKKVVVDHCHETGNVRGLLCFYCNNAIGFIREDISVALRLIDYVYTNKVKNFLLPGEDAPTEKGIDECNERD